jgi:hypothetical protein
MTRKLTPSLALFVVLLGTASAQYQGWQHSGSIYLLTAPEGANLPAPAVETAFPLLVRLNRDWFDFRQAKPHGEDLRFSSAAGTPLAYQIEQWDSANGTASIWVRLPVIQGNAHQEIKLHWGKADAVSESNGSEVFNADNGYATVLHMDEALKDEVGTVTPKDDGSTVAGGIIGQGRHFTQGKGINGGDHITNYPYSDMPFTSEAWFRAETAGAAVLGWGRYATRYNGKTGDGNEVVIHIGSPPSLSWWSDGPGGVGAAATPVLGRWYHVAATYSNGTSRIYVNGKLEGSNYHAAAMSLMNDIGMTIGGLRGSFQFAGDIDEVRVSRVARSADWLKLQYENQKAQQTLVGTLVQPGNTFSVSPREIKVAEGISATVTAQAGGAQKVYWILKRDGTDSIVAVDRFSYILDAGRVVADTAFVLQFKAVYANEVKTRTIPVAIKEEIPEPVFSLRAPAAWNGRDTIEVVPAISNLKAMQVKGAGELQYTWTVSGGAVIKEAVPGKLLLKRSQCSGKITVRLALNNGGADFAATTSILVTEPKNDPWVQRTPGKDEKPEDNQFYARDDKNEGTLHYNGTLDQAADAVFLRIFADDKPLKTENQSLAGDKTYAFAVKLKPGLIKYGAEFGTRSGGSETVLRTVTNLVCGDAYIIDGQSNAEATGPNNGPTEDPVTPINDWIRSYGNQFEGTTRGRWGNAVRTHIWGKPNYGCHQIGAWGMVLATNLVTKYGIPVCIINGAYGGTPIWHHQPNPTNRYDASGAFYENPYKIYGCLLTRVTAAKLTHGIRGVLWHQGENDSGSGAPTGDWNYKSYQQYFMDMSAAWKQDYPNIQYYYVFQVWPLPCSMGPKDDQIREAQRTLPRLYSNLRTMSTVGAASEHAGRGACHFDLEGYAQFARFLSPLLEQDNYGLVPPQAITAPNLKRAWFTSAAKDEIALDFGQPMVWKDEVKRSICLDNTVAPIGSGSVSGNVITLKLTLPSNAKTITYLTGRDWEGKPAHLLFGANGIAALTFCEVGIASSATAEPPQVSFEATVESLKQYETPEWFADAKLGIYMHWGPQSIPGVATTWYARWIYEQGSEGYKYHPDLYYTDGGIPFQQAGLNVLAHFYNENQKWNDGKLLAVATIKLDWTPNVAVQNYEYGYPDTVQHYPWQSDKTMGADWYWIRNAASRYMSAQHAIHMLIDIVSKGGNLLLNVPLTPEGELEPETVAMLTEMGRCLNIIGEAVFSTRCWMVANDGDGGIRFTRNKGNTVLYVTSLGWPNDELRIKTLGSSRFDLKNLESVTLMGAPGKLTYNQKADELSIKTGPKAPFDSPAYAFRLTFKGQIPMLN